MTLDSNNLLSQALLDRYDTEFPASSLLQIRTGSPAGAENAAGGTLLVEVVLPATPWAAAASGAKAKSGTWSQAAVAAGTAAHYRLRNAAGTRILEGTVSTSGADLNLDNTNIAIGQVLTINTFSIALP